MFKTLLVDDNDMFRQSLKSVLARHFPFMRIDEASTGAAALHHHREHQLVFMDIRLPDTNGLELTRRLKAARPSSLVCVITQFDIPEYREAANQSGASEFMVKDTLNEAAIVGLVEAMLAERARVLIVEDDAEVRAFLSALFEDCWPEVVVAEATWDQVSAATSLRPDLVLLDPRPGSEGLDQLRAIYWSKEAEAMVIMVGVDQPEQVAWALGRGIRHFVLKDEQLFDELVAAIGGKLQLPEAPRQCRLWPKGLSSRTPR